MPRPFLSWLKNIDMAIKWWRATNQDSHLISKTVSSALIDAKETDSHPAASVSTNDIKVEASLFGRPSGLVDEVLCGLSTEWWRANIIEIRSFTPFVLIQNFVFQHYNSRPHRRTIITVSDSEESLRARLISDLSLIARAKPFFADDCETLIPYRRISCSSQRPTEHLVEFHQRRWTQSTVRHSDQLKCLHSAKDFNKISLSFQSSLTFNLLACYIQMQSP